MRGRAEVPAEWFGQLLPRVGDELELVVVCRVSKIEQEQIDVTSYRDEPYSDTVGGETRVTLVLNQLKMNTAELDRIVGIE